MGDAVELVRQFCAQWEKGDVGALVEYFADDAVYHNIPVDPVSGKDAIRATIEMFTAGVQRVEFRVHHIVGDADVVLTERVDVFVLPATTIELPVMGTFEVRNGKIVAWRDYFDLNQYMRQLPE
jgi:limonene-1,2-epoxide hydrolase